jgi:hypothetical protein
MAPNWRRPKLGATTDMGAPHEELRPVDFVYFKQ